MWLGAITCQCCHVGTKTSYGYDRLSYVILCFAPFEDLSLIQVACGLPNMRGAPLLKKLLTLDLIHRLYYSEKYCINICFLFFIVCLDTLLFQQSMKSMRNWKNYQIWDGVNLKWNFTNGKNLTCQIIYLFPFCKNESRKSVLQSYERKSFRPGTKTGPIVLSHRMVHIVHTSGCGTMQRKN